LLDGVFAVDAEGRPEFCQLRPPEDGEVLQAVTLISERVQNFIERRGLEEEPDRLSENDAGLAELYAAAVRNRITSGPNVGNRVSTLGGGRIDGDSLEALSSPRCAAVNGFNLHGNVAIGALDRERLERLLRYASRPAIGQERLSRLPDGRLNYRLKRIWSDGTTAVIYEPQDFMAKLAALIPTPRVHLVRFHGVLGPAAKCRSLVIPTPPSPPALQSDPMSISTCLDSMPVLDTEVSTEGLPPVRESPPQRRNHAWAYLMMRAFRLDVLECERCAGRLRIMAAIQPPTATEKILTCLELPCRAPPLAPARGDEFPEWFSGK
jgi:putative transposase